MVLRTLNTYEPHGTPGFAAHPVRNRTISPSVPGKTDLRRAALVWLPSRSGRTFHAQPFKSRIRREGRPPCGVRGALRVTAGLRPVGDGLTCRQWRADVGIRPRQAHRAPGPRRRFHVRRPLHAGVLPVAGAPCRLRGTSSRNNWKPPNGIRLPACHPDPGWPNAGCHGLLPPVDLHAGCRGRNGVSWVRRGLTTPGCPGRYPISSSRCRFRVKPVPSRNETSWSGGWPRNTTSGLSGTYGQTAKAVISPLRTATARTERVIDCSRLPRSGSAR